MSLRGQSLRNVLFKILRRDGRFSMESTEKEHQRIKGLIKKGGFHLSCDLTKASDMLSLTFVKVFYQVLSEEL